MSLDDSSDEEEIEKEAKRKVLEAERAAKAAAESVAEARKEIEKATHMLGQFVAVAEAQQQRRLKAALRLQRSVRRWLLRKKKKYGSLLCGSP